MSLEELFDLVVEEYFILVIQQIHNEYYIDILN